MVFRELSTSFKVFSRRLNRLKLWKRRGRRVEQQVLITPLGNVIAEYSVGAFAVRLLDVGDRVEYYVEPRLPREVYSRVEEKLDDILLLLRSISDVGDVVSAVLRIDRSRACDVLYALKTITGYGKLQVLLDDPYITDISVEGSGRVWIRHILVDLIRPEQDFAPTNIVFASDSEVVQMQQIIATKCGTFLSTSNPIVETQLPLQDGGHRVHLVFPTVSRNRPEIVVRKKLPTPPHVDMLVEAKVLPRALVELFKLVIHARGSLIIAGPPGSGKTTLLRSILYYLVPRTWKVVVIEDTGEIDPPPGAPWTRYITFELGSVKVDLFDLAKASLRASGTRLLVVGETRGAEAKVLSQALLVGLGGYTTFHGSSPEEVISRFMSPPIELTASQVGMFHYVVVMGYGDKPRRQVKLLAELLYNHREDRVESNVLWSRDVDGLDVDVKTIINKSLRVKELIPRLETPLEVVLNVNSRQV
jgi:type IV secretory pathway ATPase VirB11/archaellum biosynthesis ATPase